MYEDLIDRLTLYFTGEKFSDEVARGKKDFFDEAGIMDEENPVFDMRMTQFLEWYLFTRKLEKHGQTPAEYALQASDFSMTAEERPRFENLALVQHSLFEFLKIRGDDIHIHDLFLDKTIVIHNSPISIGFSRGEFFDGRLIPDGENFHFARAFCFHPAEAAKYINSEIKKLRRNSTLGDREALLLKLMKMRYKYEQYRHLKLDYVYTNEKKVRF